MPAPGALPAAAPAAAEPVEGARKREHRYDIDLLRVLGSVGVILCHSAARLLDAVGQSPSGGRPVYWTALVADGLTRCAVPLFFAMAGWVVLVGAAPRDGRQVRDRLVRILVPMAVWTAAYVVWDHIDNPGARPMWRLGYESLFGSIRPAFHLWYLYAYVPVILLLSIAALAKAGKRPWGLGAAFVALAVAPGLIGDIGKMFHLHLPGFSWKFGMYQVAYAVGGAIVLALPSTAGRGRRLAWLAFGGCAWAAVVAYEHYVHFPSPYAGVFVPFLACAVLMGLNRISIPERYRPLLTKLGGAAFGAYLVHLMFLQAIAPHIVSAHAGWLGAAGTITALAVATAVLSFAASLLWERLRLRRWLG
ncbi:acyltransferase [Streptomyces sp. NPDC046977]|uniref:acyltransferase n=1 Tax=Streptomyces sp. NPDC046977 TaxID=3154703 RepID=UPI0033C94C8D